MTTWWHSDPGVLSSLYYIIWVVNAHYCIIIGELSSQYDITWDFISASSAHEFWRSYTRGRSDIKHIACTSCIQLLCFVFRCNTRELTGDGTEVLTGTWLDRGKLLPGLFFLLLLLLLVPPPLMVLPPDILRFRRLFGGCLDGSAKGKVIGCHRSIKCLCELCDYMCVWFAYLVVPPSSAISGTGRSWGSLWGWGCMSCVWTSAPALAPESHTAGRGNKEKWRVGDYTLLKIIYFTSLSAVFSDKSWDRMI